MRVRWTLLILLFGSCLSLAPVSLAQAPGAQKLTNTISGRVINSAGEPLPGASIIISSVGGSGQSKVGAADAKGDFQIDGLEPGLYSVSASLPGYVPSILPRAADSPYYYRIGDSVTLTLFKGGVITGTVVGPNGPLIAAGVFAIRVRDEDGKKLTQAFIYQEHATDDRGVFRFYGLPSGGYFLYAGKPRVGLIAPSAYDTYAPTYFPSATRDTASEISVSEGEEVTADIQFRAAPGYAVSGKVAGVFSSENGFGSGATLHLTNLQNHTEIATTGTGYGDNTFVFFGITEGEYEIVATQYLPTRDELRSKPQRVSVSTDVTGINLTLAPQASIAGRLVFESDPKAACAKRKPTAAQETIVYARRFEPQTVAAGLAKTEASDAAANYTSLAVGDAKQSFSFKNLPPGSYRIEALAPAAGWFVKSVTSAANARTTSRSNAGASSRDTVSVKSGDRVSGVTVTIAEGAAILRGRLAVAEGPPNTRVYLLPAETAELGNLLRFYEARPDAQRNFAIDNLAPGKYLIVVRPVERDELGAPKSIRQNALLRARIIHEAEGLKKDLTFKPCEQITGYEFPLASSATAP